jgi:hypothetical protein
LIQQNDEGALRLIVEELRQLGLKRRYSDE